MSEIVDHPFGLHPSPRYLYLGPSHKAAADKLALTIRSMDALALMLGDRGMGKSILLRWLYDWTLNTYPGLMEVVYIQQLQSGSKLELLQTISRELGLNIKNKVVAQHDLLLGKLYQLKQESRHLVVLVDEAHMLSGPQLDLVKNLFNLSTDDGFLVTVILAGETGPFKKKLAQKPAVPSRARFTVQLQALDPGEVEGLIKFRHRLAQLPEYLISPALMPRITKATDGNPRRVIKLCRALLGDDPHGWSRPIDTEALEAVIAQGDYR